ncbi:uncharacterized protein LOC129308070 [Prosopis cineraria]|uniref:uncharacterized protein LOC129298072 n=1 Tax=Prosopis cineraria TaxID=364024 RepID=UPI00240FE8D5|nr:uncharacterized protein LOC129298072 [Prosopis cineraria]XP_054792450.1 uncharacterized protein LOC129298072 [Prosopis cineraria]XP_054805032.1 uncharacterized protein LOC129308070 [Prosopis cineraria]XP_054805033.1 uncharacterized protein LOC129308070 [Prosopis cineraria]
MARRRVKRTVQKTESSPEANRNGKNEPKESQIKPQQAQFIDLEVERQATAIRAVRNVEVEHLLTELRLLRSYFSEEQLQTPVQQIFKEILPNLSVVSDKENKKFELRWNDNDKRMSMSCAGGRDVHASLLQRLSMAFPDFSSAMPPLDGFEYSSKAGRTSFLGSDNLYIKDFSMEEPSEAQALAMQEALRTPGVSSQRLSVGMTPKTLRLPKPGEMLLSVHGSPLGVYKENNMDAIHESEEG